MLRDSTITLADGRRLAYADWGDPNGKPIFLFHGTPHSRLLHRILGIASIVVGPPTSPGVFSLTGTYWFDRDRGDDDDSGGD